MHLHDHRRAIDAPRQVTNFSLPDIVQLVHTTPTPTTLKPSMNGLAAYPQFQRFRLLIQLYLIHSIPWPSQNCSPFFVSQLLSVTKNLSTLKCRCLAGLHEFLRRAETRYRWRCGDKE